MLLFLKIFLIVSLFFGVSASPLHKIPLHASEKSSLNWIIDYPNKELRFEIHVKLNVSSWFAIGFSSRGQITHADYCVFWVDWKKRVHLEDVWANKEGRIMVEKSQDCTHFEHKRRPNGILIFQFFRKFDTCDPFDYVIDNGTTHITWAEGEGPLYRLDGVNITSAKQTGFERTQLLKYEYEPEIHPPDTWKLEIHVDKVKVPNQETTYWCHVFELPKTLSVKQHIIQYEPMIQKGNEQVVHHMEVFHCQEKPDVDIPFYSGPCFDPNRPMEIDVCKRVISAWAMGASAFSYPAEAGLPIGGPDMNRFVKLEIHYNNPELRDDWIDSSGIRLYITPTLRKYDGGVLEFGIQYNDHMAIPPKQKFFRWRGFCPRECTAVSLPEKGIIVFGSQLHTHLTGVKVITKHIRNGVELRELNNDDHYSTHFQEIRRLRHLTRIIPGDELITECTFNTVDRDNVTLGGYAISDEMCVNYVHYYPKTELEVCKSAVSDENLSNYFDYLRVFEKQNTNSKYPISENYKAIEWNQLRVQVLNDLYTEGTLSMQCDRPSGEKFPGNWDSIPTTKNYQPKFEEKNCKTLRGIEVISKK